MKIIFPPRPKGKLSYVDLPREETRKKWLAQRKFNGDHCVIHRTATGEMKLYSQYGRPFHNFQLTSRLREEFENLHWEKKEYWLDAELMRNLLGSGKDVIILFDILQVGRYLYGIDLVSRQKMLASLCGNPEKSKEPMLALPVTDHIWLAECWENDFKVHFDEHKLWNTVVEGLVLKLKGSRLDNFGGKSYEVPWLVRVRIPSKTYLC